MLNHIVLMGRICKDIEMKTTQNGKSVLNFPVAVDRDYQTVERQTDFVDIVCFGNTASFVERNFRKGQLICVSGRLQSRKWEDKNGNNRVSWEVVAENVNFCGDKKENNANYYNGKGVSLEELPDGGELPF